MRPAFSRRPGGDIVDPTTVLGESSHLVDMRITEFLGR
jgi:hypothetical protein